MIEKSKRKNSYRRWWAFRGLILTLIVFIAGIGYFLTHLPEYEEIVYLNDGDLYRISLAPYSQPELIVDLEEDIHYTRYAPANSNYLTLLEPSPIGRVASPSSWVLLDNSHIVLLTRIMDKRTP